MKLTEQKYHADRGDCADEYQDLTVTVEASINRHFIIFKLMETRWRSKEEVASYLRWAAEKIERLPI